MGAEAFVYPFLIFISAVASAILAAILHRAFGNDYRIGQSAFVAVAAPLVILLMSMRDPGRVWEYVRFSMGLSALTSCSIAAGFFVITARK